jgi:hypothetical protein
MQGFFIMYKSYLDNTSSPWVNLSYQLLFAAPS